MSFGKLLALYGICTATFFAMDFIWLSTAVPRIYQPAMGVFGKSSPYLLLEKPNIPVAAAFYLVYIVGLIALAVIPGLQVGTVGAALWRGALFGFVAYATYDLTNLSTLANWPVNVTIIDMIWGTVLNSVVAVAGFYGGVWLRPRQQGLIAHSNEGRTPCLAQSGKARSPSDWSRSRSACSAPSPSAT